MRLVFLGSPPFATPVLERLLEDGVRPTLIVTPPDRRQGRGQRLEASPIALLAQRYGVELLQPPTVRDESVLERLRALEADVFLVVSYGELLRQEFIDLPKDVCLNVHPSLLPRHRGATPIPAAILAGDKETGTSLQKVVLALDAGDILLQKPLPILPGETAGELAGRLATLSGEMCVEALHLIESGEATYTPQDPKLVTECRKLSKDDGLIDWTRSAMELDRQIRALNPWPIARTSLPNKKSLAIWRAQVLPVAPSETAPVEPGRVLKAKGRFIVGTGDGVLELLEVQAAGKRMLSAEEFLRGAQVQVDDLLGAS